MYLAYFFIRARAARGGAGGGAGVDSVVKLTLVSGAIAADWITLEALSAYRCSSNVKFYVTAFKTSTFDRSRSGIALESFDRSHAPAYYVNSTETGYRYAS